MRGLKCQEGERNPMNCSKFELSKRISSQGKKRIVCENCQVLMDEKIKISFDVNRILNLKWPIQLEKKYSRKKPSQEKFGGFFADSFFKK